MDITHNDEVTKILAQSIRDILAEKLETPYDGICAIAVALGLIAALDYRDEGFLHESVFMAVLKDNVSAFYRMKISAERIPDTEAIEMINMPKETIQ